MEDVRMEGFEPPRPKNGHYPLKIACLPVPPHTLWVYECFFLLRLFIHATKLTSFLCINKIYGFVQMAMKSFSYTLFPQASPKRGGWGRIHMIKWFFITMPKFMYLRQRIKKYSYEKKKPLQLLMPYLNLLHGKCERCIK